jgi:hypothetical protein
MLRLLRAVLLVAGLILLAVPPLEGATKPPKPTPQQLAELTRLEAALAAAPDSLVAGAAYRQLIIRTYLHDRAFKFLDRLTRKHPRSANLLLTLVLARVDQLPRLSAYGIAQSGWKMLGLVTKAIAIRPSPLAYHIRGRGYIIANQITPSADAGISDLQEALRRQRLTPPCRLHAKTYAALGDAYWSIGRKDQARGIWGDGWADFGDDLDLSARMMGTDVEIAALVKRALNPWKRIDTSLGGIESCDDPTLR